MLPLKALEALAQEQLPVPTMDHSSSHRDPVMFWSVNVVFNDWYLVFRSIYPSKEMLWLWKVWLLRALCLARLARNLAVTRRWNFGPHQDSTQLVSIAAIATSAWYIYRSR
jgi:hypothetical protein